MNLLLNILAVAMLPVIFLSTLGCFWKAGAFVLDKALDSSRFVVAAWVAYLTIWLWGIGSGVALCALFVQTVSPYL